MKKLKARILIVTLIIAYLFTVKWYLISPGEQQKMDQTINRSIAKKSP